METTVKPVALEMELDFHERLLNTVGTSLASTKKRLHDAELILNLRPPDSEPEEIQQWNHKVSSLIDKRDPLEFPTLYKVKKEYESKALVRSIITGRQKIESNELSDQRMARRLSREAALIKKKVLSDSSTFGKKREGEALRFIENYRGCNSVYTSSRTLYRQDGAYEPVHAHSAVPSWIGPQYYITDKASTKNQSSGQYQLAFKSQPRWRPSKELEKNASAARRRRHIDEYRSRVGSLAGDGNISNYDSVADSASLGEDEQEETALSKASKDLEFGEKEDGKGDDEQVAVKEVHSLLPMVDERIDQDKDDDNVSVTSGISMTSRTSRDSNSMRKSVGFDAGVDSPNRDMYIVTPRTPSSSVYSELKPKSILRPRSSGEFVHQTHRQPPVKNPIFTRKDFTLKMLRMEDEARTRFFKVRDYTMNAIGAHSPAVSYVNDVEPADAAIKLDSSSGVYQHRTHGHYRKSKPIGPYTSDIFHVKPPEYIPVHKEKVDQVSLEDSLAALDTPLLATTAADPVGEESGNCNEFAAENEANFDPLNTTGHYSTNGKQAHTGYEAGAYHGLEAYRLKPLEVDIQAERSRNERTVDKILMRRADSRKYKESNTPYPGKTKTKLSDRVGAVDNNKNAPKSNDAVPSGGNLSTGSKSTANSPTPGSTGSKTSGKITNRKTSGNSVSSRGSSTGAASADSSTGSALEVNSKKAAVQSNSSIEKWFRKNEIIRANKAKRVQGDEFLSSHQPLPSIALSLTGLLLPSNPYTPDDPFIKDIFGKSAKDIGL